MSWCIFEVGRTGRGGEGFEVEEEKFEVVRSPGCWKGVEGLDLEFERYLRTGS